MIRGAAGRASDRHGHGNHHHRPKATARGANNDVATQGKARSPTRVIDDDAVRSNRRRSGKVLWAAAKRTWSEGATGDLHATVTDSFTPSDQLVGMPVAKQLAVRKRDLLDVLEPPGIDWVKVQKGQSLGYVPRSLIKLVRYAPVVPGQINEKALCDAFMLGSGMRKEDVSGYGRLRTQVKKIINTVFDDGPFLYRCYKLLDSNGDGLLAESEMRHWINLLNTGISNGEVASVETQSQLLRFSTHAQGLLLDDFMEDLIRNRLDRKAPRPVLFNWREFLVVCMDFYICLVSEIRQARQTRFDQPGHARLPDCSAAVHREMSDCVGGILCSQGVTSMHGKFGQLLSMEINVKTLSGKTIAIYVGCWQSIEDGVKAKIHSQEDIPPDEQYLVHAGELLEDKRTLADCRLQEGATIHMVPTPTPDAADYSYGAEEARPAEGALPPPPPPTPPSTSGTPLRLAPLKSTTASRTPWPSYNAMVWHALQRLDAGSASGA